MQVTIYGIPNCDTVKKARRFLDKKLDYDFVDFKKRPPTADLISRWKKAFGGYPVNTRGPTYRKIKESFEGGSDAEKTQLLIENSSAIKRPIVEVNSKVYSFGFDEALFSKLVE